MKYAFNSFPYSSLVSWQPVYPIEEVIKRIAEIGYDGLELGCTAPHAWPDYTSKERLLQIKNMFEKYGLKCSSILMGIGGGPGLNPASPDKLERENSVRVQRQVIEMGGTLDSKILLFVGGWSVFGMSRKQAWSNTVDTLKQVADSAADKGMTVVVEPTAEDSDVVETIYDALEMMEDSQRPNVGVMFDSEHVLFRHDSIADYIKIADKNLKHIHLTDASRVAPGRGATDFRPIIQALKDINYSGYVTMETGFARAVSPDDAARWALEHLKDIERNLK